MNSDQLIKKPDSIQTLCNINTAPLKSLTHRLSETLWQREDELKENDFSCFHHTQHIIFRFITANRDHRDFYATPAWSLFKEILLPIMQQVAETYGYDNPQYPKAMLARVAAGHVIDRHVDGAGSNLYTHKIHVPLQTSPEAKFFVKDESYYLEEGYAYEVNNIVSHAVENLGQEDRIHFIFELFNDD